MALGMTRRMLLRNLDAEELAYWEAFDCLEPFGDGWRQTGIIGEAVCMAGGVKKKSGEKFVVEDFMPPRTEPTKRPVQTDAQIEAQLYAVLGHGQKKKKK